MPTPIQPDRYARAADYPPADFVEAVRSGEDDYAGIPIGSWRQNDPNGGTYLAVPDDHAAQLGLSAENQRSNRVTGRPNQHFDVLERGRKIVDGRNELAQAHVQPDKPNWPEAARDAAPPVTANAGAAYAAGKFADTVKEQPQVMGDVVDGVALLGSLGFAYATAEEGEVVKAGATAAGVFALFKAARYVCEQGNRQTDMAERQQRAQIQQQRQGQMEGNASQRRLNGREDGVQVRGS